MLIVDECLPYTILITITSIFSANQNFIHVEFGLNSVLTLFRISFNSIDLFSIRLFSFIYAAFLFWKERKKKHTHKRTEQSAKDYLFLIDQFNVNIRPIDYFTRSTIKMEF